MGELFKATGDQDYAVRARAGFDRFIEYNLNPPANLAKYTDARPARGIGFPMIAINTAAQLRDSIGLETADKLIDDAIGEIRTFLIKPDAECVMETVGINGELPDHFDGRTLNPGHAIEGAWFIMNEGRHRHDDSLIKTGYTMLDWMWKRGWDDEHGGLLYFVGVDGRPVQEYWHDMKFWWPHNELVIATLMAFSLTGDSKYKRWHQLVHDWTHKHFPDSEQGEWFGYLRRDGAVSNPSKGNLFKGPFHIPRMQLVCTELLESINATES